MLMRVALLAVLSLYFSGGCDAIPPRYLYSGDGVTPPQSWWHTGEDLGWSRFLTPSRVHQIIRDSHPDLNTQWVANFGANDGVLNDPCFEFFEQGYSGIAIEPTNLYYELQANVPWNRVNKVKDYVTPHNVLRYMQESRAPFDLEIAKMDIDSYDCAVMEVLMTQYRPKIVLMEASPCFAPPIAYSTPYKENYELHLYSCFWGCSLSYISAMLRPYNYTLIQYDYPDVIYVASEYAALFPHSPHDDDTCWTLGVAHAQFYYPRKRLHSSIGLNSRPWTAPELSFEEMLTVIRASTTFLVPRSNRSIAYEVNVGIDYVGWDESRRERDKHRAATEVASAAELLLSSGQTSAALRLLWSAFMSLWFAGHGTLYVFLNSVLASQTFGRYQDSTELILAATHSSSPLLSMPISVRGGRQLYLRLPPYYADFFPRDFQRLTNTQPVGGLAVAEPSKYSVFLRLLATGVIKCVYDVGAGPGVFSLVALQHQGLEVHAWEPAPVTALQLYHAISSNQPQSPFHVHLEAVSDFSADVDNFRVSVGSAGQFHSCSSLESLGPHNETGMLGTTYVPVRVMPLDAYANEDTVNFLKVEVEGCELHVLRGAQRLIARDRPVVQLVGLTLGPATALLREWRYSVQMGGADWLLYVPRESSLVSSFDFAAV